MSGVGSGVNLGIDIVLGLTPYDCIRFMIVPFCYGMDMDLVMILVMLCLLVGL